MIGHLPRRETAASHMHSFIKKKQKIRESKYKLEQAKRKSDGKSDDGTTAEEAESSVGEPPDNDVDEEPIHLGDLDFEELKADYLSLHKGAAYRHKVVQIIGFYIPILEVLCFIWEFFISLVIIVTCIFAIYHSTFTFADEQIEDISLLLNLIYGADVVLRILVEIGRAHSNSVSVFFKVQFTFTQFICDLLVILPLVEVAYLIVSLIQGDSLYWLSKVQVFYLVKLVSLYRFENYFMRIIQDCTFNEKDAFIFKLLFYYVICCEIFSAWLFADCSVSYLEWLLLKGPFIVDDRNNSCYLTFRRRRALFLEQEKHNQLPTSAHLFFLTMDFVITIFTTTGKFATIPLRNWEFVIVILIIFMSIITNGVLASKMLDFRIENDVASYDLFYRLSCAETLYRKTCPDYFLLRLKEYYLYFWNFRQGVKDKELNTLPAPMHESIMISICQELFDKSLLFHDIESSFLTALTLRTELVLYNPGFILCTPGARCGNMFFLIQGELIVRSKTNTQHASAILRPGSIIGEVNLLFSIPYENQIETKIVCQALVIKRDSLFQLLEHFPHVLQTLREKFGRLTERLTKDYDFIGTYPLQYAVRRAKRKAINPRYIMKRNYFFLRRHEDVVDDTANTYIMSMTSFAGEHARDSCLPYLSCPVPIVFVSFLGYSWIKLYNIILVLTVLILGFILPPCAAFHQDFSTSELDVAICQPLIDLYFIDYVMPTGLVIMVIIEVIIAAPSSGVWYVLRDGLYIRLHTLEFYLDLACTAATMLSYETFEMYDVSFRNPFLIVGIVIVAQFVKVWRYFTLLDNLHPLNLLLVRYFKTFTSLVYFIHFTACFMYWMTTNMRISWIDSIAIGFETTEYLSTILKLEGPYLYPVYFATALLTSSGYSEFSAQTFNEIVIVSCIEILGFFLLALLVTQLASGIACSVLPMIRFQQRLQGINQCLKHFHVKEKLSNRVHEYYKLQYSFTKGVKLASNEHLLLYDAPYYLFQNVVDAEYRVYLQGIPLFSNADDAVFQRVVNHMRTYVLPAGITFQRAGEIRHEMYVIVNGHVGMFEPSNDTRASSNRESATTQKRTSNTEQTYTTVLGPTAHFGIRDLLFSEASKFEVRTLSYVLLYVIDQHCVKESLSHEEAAIVHRIIQEEKLELKRNTGDVAMERRNAIGGGEESTEIATETPSWFLFPLKETESFPHCTYEEYKTIWDNVRLKFIFKFILMSKTIHPCGSFAKSWTVFASLGSLGIILTLFTELFVGYRTPLMRFCNLILDLISWVDIYLKLHWAYYTKDKCLISHPAMTSSRYIKEGMFIYDCCLATPLEISSAIFQMFLYGGGFGLFFGYGPHAIWYTKLRWIRCLQIYRFFALFNLVRSSSKRRTFNFITFYIIVTLSVSILFATLVIQFGCPWGYHQWRDGDEYRLPYCYTSWIRAVADLDFYIIFNRLVIGTYYSIQVLFSVGFGDMTALNAHTELVFVIIMSLTGILLLVYVASDITAAEVDGDELRGDFIEHKSRVLHLLSRADENRGKKWIKYEIYN